MKRLEEWNDDSLWVLLVLLVLLVFLVIFIYMIRKLKKFSLSNMSLWAKRNKVYVYLGLFNKYGKTWGVKRR
jgi:hypothetical protein